jgi:Zn-dependent metalloprotease
MLALVLVSQIAAAERFVWANFSTFGIVNPGEELVVQSAKRTACGATAVTYSQTIRGMHVEDASLTVLVDARDEVSVVENTLLRGFTEKAAIPAEEAIRRAQQVFRERWKIDTRSSYAIAHAAIAGTGPASERRMEWTVYVQEHQLVAFVDARTGEVRKIESMRPTCGGDGS